AKLGARDARNPQLDVDTVKKGSRHPTEILSPRRGGAQTLGVAITEVPARTRVRCEHKLELARVVRDSARPVDADHARLEGLPKRVKNGARKLGGLIKKQHAAARARGRARANESTTASDE